MKFTENPNYETPMASDTLAGFGPDHRIEVVYPWVEYHKPTKLEIEEFVSKFLNPGTAAILRANLYHKHYGENLMSNIVYKKV